MIETSPQAPAVEPITAEYAENFGLIKADLIEAAGDRAVLRQTGAAYVDAAPFEWPTGLVSDEAWIETFIVAPDGSCTPTGDDDRLIDAFAAPARALAAAVLETAARFDIALEGPGYLACSVTPADQITTIPHFDDSEYTEDDGVALVAIVGDLGGPCVAASPIECAAVRSPSQITLEEAVSDEFAQGGHGRQVTEPSRVVVFPQFGQLHSGPSVDSPSPDVMRHLMVLRIATKPR